MTETKSQIWFITGVSTGLGRALAEAALEKGHKVIGTVRNDANKQTFEALSPGKAIGALMDVTDEKAVHDVIADIEKNIGAIDVCVNNAGYGLMGAIEETSLAEVRAQFETNVFGAMAVIQAILPHMRKRKAGHIINITSVSGLANWEGTGVYCASKHALEAIGQTLAQEMRPLGIKVTNVAPGGLRTDFGGRSMTYASKEIADYEPTAHNSRKLMEAHAGHEAGDPKKAAEAILSAVEAETPPMHLLLGADAMHYVGHHMAALQMEMADWAPATLSINFDED